METATSRRDKDRSAVRLHLLGALADHQPITLGAPRLMMSCWSQRPRCQTHVRDAMDNPFPRSPVALLLFIRLADYCKAHAQRRCSREDRKPHMVQKSSGRSAALVPQTSRSAAAATHGSRRNPTWTRVSAWPTYTVFVSDGSTGLSTLTHQLDGSLLRVFAVLWSSDQEAKKKTTFCSSSKQYKWISLLQSSLIWSRKIILKLLQKNHLYLNFAD